jgi:hypothetical protein
MINRLTLPAIAGGILASILAAPAQASSEPLNGGIYGGCKEAMVAPHSEAADACRDRGWTITRHITVGPAGWVRATDLPACAVEDGSSGPLPCGWNFTNLTGNGLGRAYWIDRTGGTHYVKGIR